MPRLLLAAALLMLVACDRNEITGPTTPLNTEFTLAPGAIMTVDTMGVRFLRVVSDSRCPSNVKCVSAGEAVIEIALSTTAGGGTYEMRLYQSNKVTHEGSTVHFVQLDPYPDTTKTVSLADYRATLRVTR